MAFLALVFQFLTVLVALVLPTLTAVHVLATSGQGVKAASRAARLVQYFLLICSLHHLIHFYPVAALLSLVPSSLRCLVELVVACCLAVPAIKAVPRVYAFGLAHYEDYLRATLRVTQESVFKPVKSQVRKLLGAANVRVQ